MAKEVYHFWLVLELLRHLVMWYETSVVIISSTGWAVPIDVTAKDPSRVEYCGEWILAGSYENEGCSALILPLCTERVKLEK